MKVIHYLINSNSTKNKKNFGMATARPSIRSSRNNNKMSSPRTNLALASKSKTPNKSQIKTPNKAYSPESNESDDHSTAEEKEDGFDEPDRCVSLSPGLHRTPNMSHKSPPEDDQVEFSQINSSTSTFASDCELSQTSPNVKSRLKNKSPSVDKYRPIEQDLADLEAVKPKAKYGIMPIIYIAFAFSFMLGLAVLGYQVNYIEREIKEKPLNITQIYQDMRADLQTLHQRLELTRHTWVQVRSQLDSMMIPSPIQPAIILVVIPNGAERTAACFTHRLGESIRNAFEERKSIVYDSKSNQKLSPENVKYELDEAFSKLQNHHSIVVHNIERLAAPAAMILHGYCDNDNAPYKQSMIILTLHINMDHDQISLQDLDKIVEGHLLNAWSGLDADEPLRTEDLSAIISRIANSPVLIKPESKAVLDELCSV